MMTSFMNTGYWYCNIAIESILQGTVFCYLFSMGRTTVQIPFTLRYVQCMVTSVYKTSSTCLV